MTVTSCANAHICKYTFIVQGRDINMTINLCTRGLIRPTSHPFLCLLFDPFSRIVTL